MKLPPRQTEIDATALLQVRAAVGLSSVFDYEVASFKIHLMMKEPCLPCTLFCISTPNAAWSMEGFQCLCT